MAVLEKGLTYLQQQMPAEMMDVIVVSIAQSNNRRAHAYVFNNRVVENRRMGDIQRIPSSEQLDPVMN